MDNQNIVKKTYNLSISIILTALGLLSLVGLFWDWASPVSSLDPNSYKNTSAILMFCLLPLGSFIFSIYFVKKEPMSAGRTIISFFSWLGIIITLGIAILVKFPPGAVFF